MSQDQLRSSYPAIATRSDVIMPGSVVPLEVGRKRSLLAVDAAMKDAGELVLIAQVKPEVEDPQLDDLITVGVRAEIAQVNKHSRSRYTVVVRAQERLRIDSLWQTEPYLVASVTPFASIVPDETDSPGLVEAVRTSLIDILGDEADVPDDVRESIEEIDDPDDLVDLAIAHLDIDRDRRLRLLCEEDVLVRLKEIAPEIGRLREVLRLKADIRGEFLEDDARRQKEKILRSRMRSIKEELGEEGDESELEELEERVATAELSAEAREAAEKQLRRMRDMQPAAAEYNIARTYVEWILDVPWTTRSTDTLDVPAARAILDADHAGLEKVKKRILEFIAVRKLAPDKQGPILLFVGPPGVGKTSLGRSIASCLGREYVRASLGGMRDDAEIRGHRRTYVGALPGRIVSGLKKAGTKNPVFVLDEIDKLSAGVRGDPASALLEALDPEQNSEFVDHYLEVPLDLSRTMFIATANQLETIPGPLLDRMEVIEIPGYTIAEKLTIARDHLIPRQRVEHGLGVEQLVIEDSAVLEVIEHYTRESGVRNLEREIGTLCRGAAVSVAAEDASSVVVTGADVPDYLGPAKVFSEVADSAPQIGVATGLVWTPVGGQILFLEARAMPGKGALKLTGQLGEVMTESVQTAMSFVRANSDKLGLDLSTLEERDVHIHLPAGAIKKDGPSAGVAVATAIASLLGDRPIRHDVAVTGEITLRGRVLPVGGIKEKVLAAHRAGVKGVILPERNEKDLVDIPKNVLDELEVHLVSRATEAMEILFRDPAASATVSTQPDSSSDAEERDSVSNSRAD